MRERKLKSEFLVGISLIAKWTLAKSVKITVTYYVHRYNVSVEATGPVFSGPREHRFTPKGVHVRFSA